LTIFIGSFYWSFGDISASVDEAIRLTVDWYRQRIVMAQEEAGQ
jgi:hypothetical protein